MLETTNMCLRKQIFRVAGCFNLGESTCITRRKNELMKHALSDVWVFSHNTDNNVQVTSNI